MRERRSSGLCDLHIVLGRVETRADAPDDLAIDHDRKTALLLDEVPRRDSRDPAMIDRFVQRLTGLLEQRRGPGLAGASSTLAI